MFSNVRPPNFECPWCGLEGVEVDFSLPLHLRLCDSCHTQTQKSSISPPVPDFREERIDTLLTILSRFMSGDRHNPWPGVEFGKVHMQNILISALLNLGCDSTTISKVL